MKPVESITWGTIRYRVAQVHGAEIAEAMLHRWQVDVSRQENPLIALLKTSSTVPEEFESRRIVDLRELQPGNDLMFQISVSPVYFVKVNGDNTITMWINSMPYGLTAEKDALATNVIRSTREKGTVEHYPAALIQDRYRQMRTRVVLPYFSFGNNVETLPPENAWVDSIISLCVRRLSN